MSTQHQTFQKVPESSLSQGALFLCIDSIGPSSECRCKRPKKLPCFNFRLASSSVRKVSSDDIISCTYRLSILLSVPWISKKSSSLLHNYSCSCSVGLDRVWLSFLSGSCSSRRSELRRSDCHPPSRKSRRFARRCFFDSIHMRTLQRLTCRRYSAPKIPAAFTALPTACLCSLRPAD